MEVISRSPFQSEISLKNGSVHIVGSMQLISQMNDLKTKYGTDPRNWLPLKQLKSNADILVNEFILKCRGEFKLSYEHAELCHCRMVSAEKVYNAIKQGAKTVEDIARTTLAGTGCGSCRSDSQILLDQFKII
ncbi:MAG: (2Fe-2S)-binding protein [Pseudobdellovibrio sp.]